MFILQMRRRNAFYLFYMCRKTKALWTQSTSHLYGHLNLPHLTPQNAVFSFLDISNKDYLIVNHLLLLFKYYIYNARDQKHLFFEVLMKNKNNIYVIGKNLVDQVLIRKQNTLKNGNLHAIR